MKKIELLSPAGNMETLKAVINAGCDSVYIGGYMFSARTFADNFSLEEMIEAIKYAHLYGVKIYVTINTLIYEDEIDSCMSYIDTLHKNNVDAIIIQDLGLLDLVRKTYPNLELHASTQMHIHNIEGVKVIEKLGVKRAVIARETSIDDIKEIIKNTNIEIEAFAHGALCFSYSGQCLMSSLIGGRSGNRGSCAGCCRQKYDLIIDDKKVNDNEYLISMKDLCTIEYIPLLLESGISCLKIEGRTKRLEYSYIVTKLYRKAIDNYYKYGKTLINEEDIKLLRLVYNREFTKGYILNDTEVVNNYRPNHIGIIVGKVIYSDKYITKIKLSDEVNRLDGIRVIEDDTGLTITEMKVNGIKKDIAYKDDVIEINLPNISINSIVVKTTDSLLLSKIENELRINKRKVPITCSLTIKQNKQIIASYNDSINKVEVTSNYIVETSINNPLSIDRIKECFNKLGDTVYEVNNYTIDFDDNIFIPMKVLNDLRRELVEKLNEKRLYQIKYIKNEYNISLEDYKEEKSINYLVDKESDLTNIKANKIFTTYDSKYIRKLNNVIKEYKDYNEVLIGELGGINKYKNFYTDYSFNVTNSYAVALLHSLGSKMVTLSLELDDRQTKLIIDNYHKRYNKHPNLEIIVYGNELVMTSKYHLLKGDSKAYLLDRFNNKYPLKIEDDLLKIYNYKPRDIKDYNKYFDMGINNVRMNITKY